MANADIFTTALNKTGLFSTKKIYSEIIYLVTQFFYTKVFEPVLSDYFLSHIILIIMTMLRINQNGAATHTHTMVGSFGV